MTETTTTLSGPAAFSARCGAFYELTKPRLTQLVLVSVAAGYVLADPASFAWLAFLEAIAGVGLVAASGSALNQYLERDLDARMARTRRRPLPAERLSPLAGLLFGVTTGVVGLLHLQLRINPLTAFLGAIALANYVFVYTPMKRTSTHNTLVGAVTGALPPMMGWTAATGSLAPGAWSLFALLFIWQMPHFLAIAWFCRNDYAAAGMKMISVLDDERGTVTRRQIALYSVAQLPISLIPVQVGLAGLPYLIFAIVVGVAVAALGISGAVRRSPGGTRTIFLASLLSLPLLLAAMIIDRIAG